MGERGGCECVFGQGGGVKSDCVLMVALSPDGRFIITRTICQRLGLITALCQGQRRRARDIVVAALGRQMNGRGQVNREGLE